MKKLIIRDIVIVIICLVIVFILYKIIPPVEKFDNVLLNESVQALIENGVPKEIIKSYSAGSENIFSPKDKIKALPNGNEWEILFNKEKTLGEYWRGENPKLEIIASEIHMPQQISYCFTENKFTGSTKDKVWGEKISLGHGDIVTPSFSIYIPTPNSECLHTKVTAKASMIFIYPEYSKSKTYTNKKKTLVRELSFFIISEEELSVLQELFPDYHIFRVLRTIVLIIFGIIFFVLGIELKEKIEWINELKKSR